MGSSARSGRCRLDPGRRRLAQALRPILVVGTTGDPFTPLVQSQQLADVLESGVLLVREGEGHTAYGEDKCVDDAIDAYILDLTVPADGTRC